MFGPKLNLSTACWAEPIKTANGNRVVSDKVRISENEVLRSSGGELSEFAEGERKLLNPKAAPTA